MAYNTKKILRDRNGDPIPQSYDSDSDRYVPSEIDTRLKAIEDQQQEILERLDKPIDTQVTGSNVEQDVNVKNYPDTQKVEITKSSDSIYEYYNLTDTETVAPEENLMLMDFEKVTKQKIRMSIRFEAESPRENDFFVRAIYKSTEEDFRYVYAEVFNDLEKGDGRRYYYIEFPVKASYINLVIQNNSEKDITIEDVIVLGVD